MTRTVFLALVACVLCGSLLGAARQHPAPQPRQLSQAAPQSQSEGTIAALGPPAPRGARAPEREPEPALAPEVEAYPPLVRFGDERLRHTAPVRSLALTPDGTRLLTATRVEPVLRLWDVKSARLLRAVRVAEEFTQSMTILAITPNARARVRHPPPVARQRKSNEPWHEPATVDLATGAVVLWSLGRARLEDPHPIFALYRRTGKRSPGIIGGEVSARGSSSPAPVPRVGDDFQVGSGHWRHLFLTGRDADRRVRRSKGRVLPRAGQWERSAPEHTRCQSATMTMCAPVFWQQPNRVVAALVPEDGRVRPGNRRRNRAAGASSRAGADAILSQVGGGKLIVKEYWKKSPLTPLATFDLAALARGSESVVPRWRGELFAVSANGCVLALASDHAVRLFDPRTGTPLHPDLERAPFEPLARLQILPDGACVLGCTTADTAHAWGLSDGRALAAFDGSPWLMTCSALSPDGRLASGGLSKAGCPLIAEFRSGRSFPLPAHEKSGHAPEVIGFTGPNRVVALEPAREHMRALRNRYQPDGDRGARVRVRAVRRGVPGRAEARRHRSGRTGDPRSRLGPRVGNTGDPLRAHEAAAVQARVTIQRPGPVQSVWALAPGPRLRSGTVGSSEQADTRRVVRDRQADGERGTDSPRTGGSSRVR